MPVVVGTDVWYPVVGGAVIWRRGYAVAWLCSGGDSILGIWLYSDSHFGDTSVISRVPSQPIVDPLQPQPRRESEGA